LVATTDGAGTGALVGIEESSIGLHATKAGWIKVFKTESCTTGFVSAFGADKYLHKMVYQTRNAVADNWSNAVNGLTFTF